jgi:hypothetical protein
MLFETEEDRQKFVDWISGEISLADSEMAGRREKWDRWRRQREALPEFAKKTFPGSNRTASNVVPPISMSNTNNVYADLNNMFGGIHPWLTVSAIREDSPEDIAIAKFWTRYLDILGESRNDLDKRRRSKIVHYETGSLGTCMVKVPWTKRSWMITETDDNGIPVDTEIQLHNGAEIVPVPAEDCLMREAYQDPQTAPWIGFIIHHTWPEIQQLGEQDFYQGVDELEEWSRKSPTDAEASQQAREGAFQMVDSDIWDLHEVYFFWEIQGRWRDCVATVELNSGLVLREGYNELGYRPVEDFSYLLRPHRREGIGVGHMTDHMQEEGTMIHNARLDSIHASVFPMFSARKGSGPKQDEPIYPAKIWMMDDPSRDLTVIKLPEPGMTSFQAENMSLMYAQKATGKGDASGGFADQTVKTRDSPGLMSMRLKQSGGVFGSVAEGIEDSWGMVGYLVILQNIHHKTEVLENENRIGRLSPEDMKLLEKALSIPKAEIPIRLKFSVRTSDIEETFEAKRQNLLTRIQIENMFFQQTFPIVQMLFSPQGQMMTQQAPEMFKYLARMYTSRCRMQEEAIKFFGEEETSKFVPEYKKLEAMLDIQRIISENQQMLGGLINVTPGARGPVSPAAPQGAPVPAALPGGGTATAQPGGASGTGGPAAGPAVEPGMGGTF